MTLAENRADQSETELTCSQCGEIVGNLVIIADEELIQIGALVISQIDGNCARCGQEFHYSLNARRLEKLINRRISRKRA
jgi:DNA-directed RNA polymerase subunit RPC12/RpoP